MPRNVQARTCLAAGAAALAKSRAVIILGEKARRVDNIGKVERKSHDNTNYYCRAMLQRNVYTVHGVNTDTTLTRT